MMSLIAAAVLYSSIIPITAFLLTYVIGSNWRSTPVGRIIVGLLLSILAVLLIGLTSFLFDPDFLNIIRIVVYGAMSLGFWHLLWVLIGVQRAERKECKRRATETD